MATLAPKKAPAEKPEIPMELRTVKAVFGTPTPSPNAGTKGVPRASTTYDDLMCGIELEIENLPDGGSYYYDQVGGFWNLEEDGSLRPRGQSWEFISQPAMLSQMVSETERLFRVLSIDENRHYSDRCSVHIHTNVQDWTQQQVASLALVYPVFESVLFKFVNFFKKKEEQGYCRDTNLYCIPWSDCRHNKNFVDTLFNNPGNMRSWQKYTALNMLPVLDKGTVEWRHMHGTCDMEKLRIWFNIIGAMMKFCKTTPFEEIVEVIQRMNDVSTYQQFFEQVLMGQFPYDEEYRRLMAEGVLNAKYSLINWEANKDKPRGKRSASLSDIYARIAAGVEGQRPNETWWMEEDVPPTAAVPQPDGPLAPDPEWPSIAEMEAQMTRAAAGLRGNLVGGNPNMVGGNPLRPLRTGAEGRIVPNNPLRNPRR